MAIKRVALAFLLALLALALLPTQAFALDTAKATARPNGDSGSDVYGGIETRITWEGQADADESVSRITLTMPDGTDFGVDDARITILSGEKLMDRNIVSAAVAAEGSTFVAELPEATQLGAYLRIELYEVVFPSSGGEFELLGTYSLADGTIKEFTVDPISVVGISGTEALSNALEQQEWVQQWNSNKFLRLFFNPAIIVSSIPLVFNGFLLAIAIVAVAFPCAIPVGLLLSIMRMASTREGATLIGRFAVKLVRGIASLYVNVVRGTPLFLQIYIAFFGLPLAGITIPTFVLGVVVLAMNSAAYMCEIFRAGIQSIPRGQTEASRSLGMNGAQTMIFVIIPQTVRRVIPTLTSEFILLYKDTSMLAAVGVMEMVYDAKMIVASTGSITPYIVAACFYLVITLPLAKLVGNLERKLDGVKQPKAKKKGAVAEALAVAGDGESAGSADIAEAAADSVELRADSADLRADHVTAASNTAARATVHSAAADSKAEDPQ